MLLERKPIADNIPIIVSFASPILLCLFTPRQFISEIGTLDRFLIWRIVSTAYLPLQFLKLDSQKRKRRKQEVQKRREKKCKQREKLEPRHDGGELLLSPTKRSSRNKSDRFPILSPIKRLISILKGSLPPPPRLKKVSFPAIEDEPRNDKTRRARHSD